MELSRRITGIDGGGGNGWELYAHAKALVAEGHDIVQLTIGEHDIGTDRGILDAMHASAIAGATGYTTIAGLVPLRQAIAARVTARTGVETAAENVLVVPGAQSGLYTAHVAALDAGDAALFIDPYYATYPGTIRSAGGRPVPVAAVAEDGFQPRAEALDRAAEETGARSLLINSPNNPTGVLYGRATMDGIAAVAEARDLWVISDEVYDGQVWKGTHLSPRQLPGMAERTLVIGSFSKSHAMTGSRLGWIVGPEDAIRHMTALALNTTYGVPGFIQEAAIWALAQGEGTEEVVSAPFRRRHALAHRVLAGSAALSVVPSDATMYAMVDIRATGLSGADFAWRLLEEDAIAVMPGESFGTASAGHVRIALTVADDVLERALTRLRDKAEALAAAAASDQPRSAIGT